ncbi:MULTISPECIES: enterobactin synthase subunit EntD [Raoultella]|uniref:Enterobactin synthase component D n=1 Tax=Raoultella lignicola TaxID=3040939 RepID=A0ABU9FDV2_9ENTR
MQIQHAIIQLAGHSLMRVDFDPATFQATDLLWLPHHARLANGARKRQTEHLAGRIAAAYALREVGVKAIPGIGEQRQPLWPAPWYGSISHCEHSALAVVSERPVGVDIERLFSPSLASELESSIINPAECAVLNASGLPFELALTLAFSAKESGFKACHPDTQAGTGFSDFQLVHIEEGRVLLRLSTGECWLSWMRDDEYVITLCAC